MEKKVLDKFVKVVRCRRFCFTINNYKKKTLDKLEKMVKKYMVVGKEVGESGTKHYQGYVEYGDAKTLSAVIKIFKSVGGHVEVAKGTGVQNEEYCKKEECIYEFGEMKKQGSRGDLAAVKNGCKKGDSIRYMLDEGVVKNYQGLKMAEALMKYVEPVRTWEPHVIWRWGATGVGKTRWVYQNYKYEDVFVPINFKWWEGYDAHEVVLLDEIRGDFCKYHEMLKLLDGIPLRVESKGGSRQLLAKTMIITSCYHPEDLWNTIEDKTQLLRRIDSIEEIHRSDYTEVGEVIISSPTEIRRVLHGNM